MTNPTPTGDHFPAPNIRQRTYISVERKLRPAYDAPPQYQPYPPQNSRTSNRTSPLEPRHTLAIRSNTRQA